MVTQPFVENPNFDGKSVISAFPTPGSLELFLIFTNKFTNWRSILVRSLNFRSKNARCSKRSAPWNQSSGFQVVTVMWCRVWLWLMRGYGLEKNLTQRLFDLLPQSTKRPSFLCSTTSGIVVSISIGRFYFSQAVFPMFLWVDFSGVPLPETISVQRSSKEAGF